MRLVESTIIIKNISGSKVPPVSFAANVTGNTLYFIPKTSNDIDTLKMHNIQGNNLRKVLYVHIAKKLGNLIASMIENEYNWNGAGIAFKINTSKLLDKL